MKSVKSIHLICEKKKTRLREIYIMRLISKTPSFLAITKKPFSGKGFNCQYYLPYLPAMKLIYKINFIS